VQLHGCSIVDIVLVVHMETSIVETPNLENQHNVSCDIISQGFVNRSLWVRLNAVHNHLEYRNTIAGSPLGEQIFFFRKNKVCLSKTEFLNFCFLTKKISKNDLK